MLTKLSKFGYRCVRISASGQRKGKRRDEAGIDGDIIALAPINSIHPHLSVEVGGPSKSVAQSLLEMTEHPLPAGFVPIVARCLGRGAKAWRYHFEAHERGLDSLDELFEAMRAA
jgi:hypothetical protein